MAALKRLTAGEEQRKPLIVAVAFAIAIVALLVGTVFGEASATGHESTASGEGGCPYIDPYLAPFDLPVSEYPTHMLGAGPDQIDQREVGPEACEVVRQADIENIHGVPYRHVTLGVSGTLFGYTSYPHDPRNEQFSDNFLMVAPVGQVGPYRPGVYHYEWSTSSPAENAIIFPEDPDDWNGGLWVLAHGVSYYSGAPSVTFSREPGVYNRYMNRSDFAAALIDEGYAVAHTRRGGGGRGTRQPTEFAVLDDGDVVGGSGQVGMAVNGHSGIIRDYAVMAQNFLAEHLGQRPERTFFRGHSAGATVGRMFNTIPGWNVDHQGEKLFDGIYLSDTAAGRGPIEWPLVAEIDENGVVDLVDAEDQLTFDAEHRAGMANTIETMHGMYAGPNWDTPLTDIRHRVPASYRELKLENFRQLTEKGLGDIWRFFEIADSGHNDATGNRTAWPENAADMIDIGGISISLKRQLDDWASTGAEPSNSRANAHDVRELSADIGPRVELPESACPRGVFRPYMPRPNGSSSHSLGFFVPFADELREQVNAYEMSLPDGFEEEWLEPLDVRGRLIDMSGEFVRNTRLTIRQAWFLRYRQGEETGILGPDEELTRARYATCVNSVADALHADGLLTDEARHFYFLRGLNDPLMVDSPPLAQSDCKQGGWQSLGFQNQGKCVKYVEAGKL